MFDSFPAHTAHILSMLFVFPYDYHILHIDDYVFPDCLFCEQAHSEKIIATANSTLIVFFIFCPPIKTIISNLLATNSILCCLRTASPQGIAALAAQGGVATLTEGRDETFSVRQFFSADRE